MPPTESYSIPDLILTRRLTASQKLLLFAIHTYPDLSVSTVTNILPLREQEVIWLLESLRQLAVLLVVPSFRDGCMVADRYTINPAGLARLPLMSALGVGHA